MTSQSGTDEAVIQSAGERSGIAWLLPTAALLGSLILGLVLWQCSDSSVDAPSAEAGLVAYRESGCAACHGQTALGGSGPAMGGHSAEQVVRQVRAPFAAMPMFTVRELSDSDLAAIVKYVEELEPVEHDVRWGTVGGNGLDLRDALAAHHWLALTAIRNGDLAETAHQIEHINEFITSEHLRAMNEITVLLDNDAAAAELRLARMSAGYVPDAALIDRVNLRLVAQALVASDIDEASRHLEVADDGDFAALAAQVRQAIASGTAQDGADVLIEALGHDALGLTPDSEG